MTKSMRLLSAFLWVFLLSFVALAPGDHRAVAAPLCAGGDGAILQAGCGDGICDPYMGETATSCPADCASSPPVSGSTSTFTPTSTSSPSPTATSTRRVVTKTPTLTLTPTSTSTATSTPEEASLTPTETPAEATVMPTPSGGLAALPGCDLVAYESRAQAWQKGYGGASSPQTFIPQRTDNREIYVCTVPPVGQLCIPIYQGLLSASQEDINNIVLVDCSTNGTCQIYEGLAQQVEEAICFDVTQTDRLSCSAGCALAPKQVAAFILPLLGNVPIRLLAPFACLIALLLMGITLAIVFVSRRSRSREASKARSVRPIDWDLPPRPGGESSKGTQNGLPSEDD